MHYFILIQERKIKKKKMIALESTLPPINLDYICLIHWTFLKS